jgi:hypothetical protein
MDRERWQRIDTIFKSALELRPEERAAFLERACAGDAGLRREVESLIAHDLGESALPTKPLAAVAAAAEQLLAGRGGREEGGARPPLSSDSIDDARFVPGVVLGGRYRIVGLLGRGGMGEVYRADDLVLKQAVALKLLPESLSADGTALERFRREVRVARQISHPNVCRVYDIGEADGLHFLSMEFIKGEEVASVIKRFGRLPADKAAEIARQICAGLAAAHKGGVLHRDLKPANVMIDEAGDARVTDFGLAALAEETRGDELAGTPAYMSPEQLAGGPLTTRSDIYSLGLVLYELFTGRRAFDARTLPELLRLRKSDAQPTSPSSHVKDLDPLVERVIERCLETDPARRPASALEVAAALPGGDPLAAALAMGETPSPEMVAAAPKEGTLKPWVAVSLLACVLAGLALIMLLSGETSLYRRASLPFPPEVLAARAQEVTRRLGHDAQPTDTARGFFLDYRYLRYLSDSDPSPGRFGRLRAVQPAAINFWYRQSPHHLMAVYNWRVDLSEPPHDVSGMVRVTLDTLGRLTYFEAVPPQLDAAAGSAPAPPDWSALFREAGFDPAAFKPAASQWTPPQAYDARAAWEGFFPDAPDTPVRVEAAGYRGRPVYFEVVTPWRSPARSPPAQSITAARMGTTLLFVFYFGALIFCSLLAWKNLRLGRGDRSGALRLALFIFALRMISWAFMTDHVPNFDEVSALLVAGLQSAVFVACVVGLMYLALEPFLRRRWPERIISWSRLLAGHFRDPLVGRDVLIGAAFGVGFMLILSLQELLPLWLGGAANLVPLRSPLLYVVGLLGLEGFMPLMPAAVYSSLLFGFIVVFIILFFAMLLRRDWLGIGVAWLLFAGLFFLRSVDYGLAGALTVLLAPTVIVLVAARFGLLAIIVLMLFQHLRAIFPVTTELSAWYAGGFVLASLCLLALTLYGFYTSLGGQRLFRGELLGE